jgi:thiol-disulfide isomerase/thioredoxin
MKKLLLLAIILFAAFSAFAQHAHEYAPVQEHELKYKNWTFKNVADGTDTDLRSFAGGKKLVMVVYFAPWCPNWKYEAELVESLYQKYKGSGFAVIGVGEYGTVADVVANLKEHKVTFPVVSESESRGDVSKTTHYGYRKETGDTRNWGSPWHIFLEPAQMKKDGDTLTKSASIVSGELIEADTETFIRQKLGLPALPAETKKTETAQSKTPEVCTDDPKASTLKKP